MSASYPYQLDYIVFVGISSRINSGISIFNGLIESINYIIIFNILMNILKILNENTPNPTPKLTLFA